VTQLWPHQTRAVGELREALRAHRSVLLVLPTGAGKTRTASHVIGQYLSRAPLPTGATYANARRVLFLVHRIELAKQAAAQLPAPVRVISGDLDDGPEDAPVIVASVQTLLARGLRPEATMVVVDEAHHYVSDEWCDVVRAYDRALIVGLTATPERSDGRPLGDLFQGLVAPTSIAELTRAGVLVPCEVYAPPARQQGLASEPHDALARHRDTARPWRKAVVFAANVAHAEAIAEQCRGMGWRTGVVTGDVGDRDRAATLEAFRAGELDVIVNVFVLTEGWDDPSTDCLVLARGCTHGGTYLQMVGRVLRASPGKSRCVVLDLTGATHDHGLPDAPRRYSLEGKGVSAEKAIAIRQCLACGAAYQPGPRVCPVCAEPVPPPPPPRLSSAELGRVMSTHSPDKRRATWEALQRTASERGYKRGWAAYQYRVRYGQWPSFGRER
jgi:DNA repair protein RadD